MFTLCYNCIDCSLCTDKCFLYFVHPLTTEMMLLDHYQHLWTEHYNLPDGGLGDFPLYWISLAIGVPNNLPTECTLEIVCMCVRMIHRCLIWLNSFNLQEVVKASNYVFKVLSLYSSLRNNSVLKSLEIYNAYSSSCDKSTRQTKNVHCGETELRQRIYLIQSISISILFQVINAT